MQTTRHLVLNHIRAYTRTNGYAPSLREIGDAVGPSSLSSVSHQLDALEREGSIHRTPGRNRSIVVKEVNRGKDPHHQT